MCVRSPGSAKEAANRAAAAYAAAQSGFVAAQQAAAAAAGSYGVPSSWGGYGIGSAPMTGYSGPMYGGSFPGSLVLFFSVKLHKKLSKTEKKTQNVFLIVESDLVQT